MVEHVHTHPLRAVDSNGNPASGAKLYIYLAGTATPVTVYQDEALSIAHGSPILSDSSGIWPAIYYGGGSALRAVATDASDVALPGFPIDPVVQVSTTTSAASAITFTPYTGFPQTTVQSVIEAMADLWNAVTTYGKSLIAAADAAAARTVLGLGTSATTPFLDEDNMASDSATSTASQQSIKAYVDAVSTTVTSITPVLATAVSASGTAVNFTSIPSGINKIDVMVSGLSSNGTNDFLVQLGDSGGVEATGYTAAVEYNGNSTTDTTGFIFTRLTAAADVFSGIVQLRRINGNQWVSQGATDVGGWSAGTKTLSAELDRIRVTTVGGTDTFDAGTVNIIYSK